LACEEKIAASMANGQSMTMQPAIARLDREFSTKILKTKKN
jgi:hypothetical protein